MSKGAVAGRAWFVGAAVALLVGLLVVASAPSAAQAGCKDDLGDAGKATGTASDLLGLFSPLVPEGAKDGAGALGKGLKALGVAVRFAEGWCECVATGKDAWGCAAQTLADDWLCLASMAFGAPNPNNPFSLMAIAVPAVGGPAAALYSLLFEPDNPYCDEGGMDLGPGTLKCCKYTPDQNGCHSAFNTPTPINCEGNPAYGGSAASFGPCMVPPTGAGCLCTHIPECNLDGLADDSGYARSHRCAGWFRNLEGLYVANAASDDGECSMAFGFFEGCRGWLNVITQGEPFIHFKGGPISPYNGAMVIELNRQFAANAAFRVIFALPNGLARFDYAAGKTWTDEQKAEHLAGVADPQEELSKYLGPCGLALIKESLPERWSLLAAPAPDEGEPDKDPALNWKDGCLQGQVAVFTVLSAAAAGATVELTVEVDDPEAEFNQFGFDPLAIDWGDNTVTHVHYSLEHPNNFTHTYRRSGEYAVLVTHVNSAGLAAEGSVQVEVGEHELFPRTRTLTRVSLVLSAENETPMILGVWGVDDEDNEHYMGRFVTGAGDGLPQSFGSHPLDAQGPQNLVGLKLRGVEEGQTGDAAWLLEGIETYEYRSGGPAEVMAWGGVPLGAVTGKQGEPEWVEDAGVVRLPSLTSSSYFVALPCTQRQCGLDEMYGVDCGKCGVYDTCLDSGLCEPGEEPVVEPDEDTGGSSAESPPDSMVEEPNQPEVVEQFTPDLATGDDGAAAIELTPELVVPGLDNSGQAEAGGGSEDVAAAGPEDNGGNKGGGGCSLGAGINPRARSGQVVLLLFLALALASALLRRRFNG